jgi:ubiquinone/menaquinone biosynthesis C-methylase UbiE
MLENYEFWKDIWDGKGRDETESLIDSAGWTNIKIPISSKQITRGIISLSNITKQDKILEIGCGVGFLSREFKKNYTGVDYSVDIVKRHLSLFPEHDIHMANANNLPFEDNSYDVVFCCGVFQYLPNDMFAEEVINEMIRVSNRVVLLADLKNEKTHDRHYVYPKDKLTKKGFVFSDCIYDSNDKSRYNALLEIKL